MGARKRKSAELRKESMKTVGLAKLNNCPSSPRKMRLVCDLIRNVEVTKALDILKFNTKDAARDVEKLLKSAIANWQAKNSNTDETLVVKEVFVDSARVLKRLRPAPQGRGYRIRKRSNHVTIVLDNVKSINEQTV